MHFACLLLSMRTKMKTKFMAKSAYIHTCIQKRLEKREKTGIMAAMDEITEEQTKEEFRRKKCKFSRRNLSDGIL
jgi:uncharacterized ferredoxin-like protein